jgi:hypothetical protein
VPKNKALAVNELPILARQGHSREGNFIPIYAKKQVKHRAPAVISAGPRPAVPGNPPFLLNRLLLPPGVAFFALSPVAPVF